MRLYVPYTIGGLGAGWRPLNARWPLLLPSGSSRSLLGRCASTAPTRTSTTKDVTPDTSINPPASTRPPPLELPTRDPAGSAISYYINLGKAYVKFYKTGLTAVLLNRSLLYERLDRTPQSEHPSLLRPYRVPSTFTRADWVLLWRVRHDFSRLPLFGLVLLICGEFTPLVVVYFDAVVPYTCRLPKQIGRSLGKAEARRQSSFQHLEYEHPEGALSPKLRRRTARAHVLRSLHLVGTFWDRIGFVPPLLWWAKGNSRMAYLEGDDALLRTGGIAKLLPEEVKLACEERGLDVLGRKHEELREHLGDWLRLTAAEELEERRKRMTVLLTVRYALRYGVAWDMTNELFNRSENWPKNRDFALPEWHL